MQASVESINFFSKATLVVSGENKCDKKRNKQTPEEPLSSS